MVKSLMKSIISPLRGKFYHSKNYDLRGNGLKKGSTAPPQLMKGGKRKGRDHRLYRLGTGMGKIVNMNSVQAYNSQRAKHLPANKSKTANGRSLVFMASALIEELEEKRTAMKSTPKCVLRTATAKCELREKRKWQFGHRESNTERNNRKDRVVQ